MNKETNKCWEFESKLAQDFPFLSFHFPSPFRATKQKKKTLNALRLLEKFQV